MPSARDMFGGTAADPVALTEHAELFKNAMADALAFPAGTLTKSADPGVVSSIRHSLATSGLNKDLDLAGPGTTGGLHTYDLEAPAKTLVPRTTPLRNRIPRRRGIGTAHEYKRITGFSGSGTGGVGAIHPGLGETETNAFGALTLRRGKIIEYAGDQRIVPYRFFALSDRVTWAAQFAGVGFEDLRQRSTTSLLYSAMLQEERMLLGDRGTASGFLGALATPAAPTVTFRAPTSGETALTGAAANVWVKITATTMWGETPLSSAGTAATVGGDVGEVTWAHVPGATGYRVFVSTAASSQPANTASWLQGTTAANRFVLQGALVTAGTAASTVTTTGTTAHDNGYDGILSYVLDPAQSGHIEYVNGPLLGDAPIQDTFADLYDSVQADPDEILANGHDRRTLSDLLKDASSSSYRITLVNDPTTGSTGSVGALATAVQNEVTGKMVDLTVHPFCPRGVMPILSWTLPLPDSDVESLWTVFNCQDYMAVDWPVIEHVYDQGVYWQGSFVSYGPAFSGAVAGITA